MQRVAGLVVVGIAVLAACKTETTNPDDFPVNPGGNGGGGGSTFPDAAPLDAPGDGGDGAVLSARVCVQADLRDRASCASTGAGGIVVTVGSETATTDDTGAFQIARPVGDSLVWRASGDAIVASRMPYGSSLVIPAVAQATYDDLLIANGLLPLVAGQGSIVARLVENGQPLVGATADIGAAQSNATYYDGASATAWEQDATGGFGIAWLPAEQAGGYTLTVVPALGDPASVPVVVEDGAITFATAAVP